MSQNIISLSFTDVDLTLIDEALALLEQKLAALVGLSPEERRGLVKMGDRPVSPPRAPRSPAYTTANSRPLALRCQT